MSSINISGRNGNSIFSEGNPRNNLTTWSNYSAVSNIDLGGNQIQNVSVIETQDISGIDAGDILPLIENQVLNTFTITDLFSYDTRIENDLSLGGRLLSQDFLNLSGYVYTLGGGSGVDISEEFWDLSGRVSTQGLSETLTISGNAGNQAISNVSNLGIGKASSSYNLDISGSLNMSLGNRSGTHPSTLPFYITADIGADSSGFQFGHINGTTGFGFGFNSIYMTGTGANLSMNLLTKGTGSLYLKPGGTTRTQIDSNGDVYFNNYSIGTLSITSGGLVTSSSDKRAKKNIEYIELDGLEIVNKIKPARFQYHHEEHDYHTGFVADQLIEAGAGFVVDGKKYEYEIMREEIPGENPVIKLNEDGTPMLDYSKPRMKGVEHSGLIAILVKAIQQLNTKVDKLTKLVI
jgi:hypothetical protein